MVQKTAMNSKMAYGGVTKRKQACIGCRTRKKKCDALHPACTPCKRWGVICDYNDSPSLKSPPPPPTRPDIALGMPGYTVFTDFPHDYRRRSDTAELSLHESYNDISSSSDSYDFSDPSTSPESYTGSTDSANGTGAPPPSVVIELVEIFILRYTKFLPCFHLESLRADVKSGEIQRFSPCLLFAVLAIAAPQHSDPAVIASQPTWASTASSLYDATGHDAIPPLRVLQAAACIVFLSIARTDYSKAWLVLGKAWRQSCAMGFNRIDATTRGPPILSPEPQHPREEEERRRTMWTLMMLDADHSYPAGWASAIDSKQVALNKPMNDRAFQLMTPESPTPQATGDMLEQLLKTYQTLRSSVQHIYALQRPDDPYDHLMNLRRLMRQSDLLKASLQLSLKQPYLDELQLCYLVWTGLLNAAIIILLNHQSEEDWEILNDSCIPESDRLSSDECFSKCVCASADAAEMINSIPESSSDILWNPHIAAAIYICSRPLLIIWHETQDPLHRKGISTFLHYCDRLAAEFPPLGKKFKCGIEFCLGEDEYAIQEMRTSGAKTNLAFCSIWFERSRLNSDTFVPGKIRDWPATGVDIPS